VPTKVHKNEDGEWETGDVLKLRPSAKRRKTLEQATRPVIPATEATLDQASGQATAPRESPPNTTTTTKMVDQPASTDGTTAPKPETEFETSREESFTTGPHGAPTHWRQAVFLLKTPVELGRGKGALPQGRARANLEVRKN